MAKVLDSITPELSAWIAEQHLFFVATAPLATDGHVNCSPKGGDTLRVLGPHHVAYADLTGSGVETIAHLQENGRIVIMLCAFAGAPHIVRLHGTGTTIYPTDPHFAALRARFPELPGLRAIIQVEVSRISDSCGMSVPFFDYVGHRDQLDRWAAGKGEAGLTAYRQEKNARSLDHLEGYRTEGRP